MNPKACSATTDGELGEVLKDFLPDMLVVQARDKEGNGFLPLMMVETGLYCPQDDIELSITHAALLPLNLTLLSVYRLPTNGSTLR